MHCRDCIFGKKNQGFIIPQEDTAFFCSKVANVRDEHTAELLEPLLRMFAEEDRCPHFDAGSAHPDAYRALDLDEVEPRRLSKLATARR